MNHSERIAYLFVIALLSTSVVVLAVVLSLLLLCKKKPVQSQETVTPIKPSAQVYPLTNIDAATDGFNHRRIVGEGRLGTVYAAIFEKGEIAAVKRIHSRHVLSNAGFGFSRILRSISSAQHPNVVPIIGYSEGPGERIIVMEFVGMVCLDFYLHQNPEGASLLDWNHRLKIAAGAAKGLEYLHEGVAPNIVHGCVKASNILIDVNFCARICDYGLSFLAPQEKRGLVGYVDDEYWRGSGACKESDVYGFGIVLLELLSGRLCEEGRLVNWASPLIKEMRISELLDPGLVIPDDIRALVRLAKVASACVGNSRKSRPSICQVATILSNLEMD
ncbi:serine/threonine-protein kinase-like protein CR4 [Prunus avium]|uniref:Serine/threonine-protein kinase-like protein CR4 n=1 Tax=Prunus avium TaxID=42229 RepID=A0A6P5TT32_PRUAV|nr:serine/threonine-protein kinase-like protein CR4 [Prunus avium]